MEKFLESAKLKEMGPPLTKETKFSTLTDTGKKLYCLIIIVNCVVMFLL